MNACFDSELFVLNCLVVDLQIPLNEQTKIQKTSGLIFTSLRCILDHCSKLSSKPLSDSAERFMLSAISRITSRFMS